MLVHDKDGVQIYHGDCADILPTLPKVDLIVTSPPYDGLRDYGGDQYEWDKSAGPIADALAEGGVMCWVVGEQVIDGGYSCNALRQCLSFVDDYGLLLHDRIIIESRHLGALTETRFMPTWDYLWVLSNGKPKTFNPLKDKPNASAGRYRITRTSAGRHGDGERAKSRTKPWIVKSHSKRTSIWYYGNGDGNEPYPPGDIHPARMHMSLALDLITAYSNEDDVVLDPFSGSGTTARAAQMLGRKAIGIEIHEPYIDAAIQARFAQPLLWTPE